MALVGRVSAFESPTPGSEGLEVGQEEAGRSLPLKVLGSLSDNAELSLPCWPSF